MRSHCLRCLLITLLPVSALPLRAQTALLPPSRSDADYLLRLAFPQTSADRQLRYESRYRWSNNVLPVLRGEDLKGPVRVRTAAPFLLSEQLTRWEWRTGRWSGEYVNAVALQLSGSRDAAQLWVDAEAGAIDPTRIYDLFVSERRGSWEWWGATYTAPLRSPEVGGVGAVGLRYLRCRRFREGWLAGSHLDRRLAGDVRFLSSRGIGLEAPPGKGFALDASAVMEGPSGWRALLAVEGLLGRVWWGQLRQVTARADTTALQEDPDGFIRSLPLLTGREETRSLRRAVERQVVAGIGRTRDPWTWVFFYADRSRGPEWHAGGVRQAGRGPRLLVDLQVPASAASVGVAGREGGLIISLSSLDAWQATTLGVQGHLQVRW